MRIRTREEREREKRTRGRVEVRSTDMLEESEKVNPHPDRLYCVGERKVKVLPLPLHLLSRLCAHYSLLPPVYSRREGNTHYTLAFIYLFFGSNVLAFGLV